MLRHAFLALARGQSPRRWQGTRRGLQLSCGMRRTVRTWRRALGQRLMICVGTMLKMTLFLLHELEHCRLLGPRRATVIHSAPLAPVASRRHLAGA